MKKKNNTEESLAIDRLVIFLDTINVNRREFEQNVGLANGYVGNQLKRRGNISSKMLNKILLEYPELNVTWLLTGHSLIIPRNTITNLTLETSLVAG